MEEDNTEQKELEAGQGLTVAPETLSEVKPVIDHSKLYVWVADAGNNRIQKFDGNGKFLLQFGRPAGTRAPYNPGEFKTPMGVAVDSYGNIWVADTGCHRIQKFDEEGNFILEFGQEGWGSDKFYMPEGIVVESSGTILVGDTANNCFKRYDDDGEFLLGFGFSGDFDGFFKKSDGGFLGP